MILSDDGFCVGNIFLTSLETFDNRLMGNVHDNSRDQLFVKPFLAQSPIGEDPSFVVMLGMHPHVFNAVEFRSVGHVEDQRDLEIKGQLSCFVTSMNFSVIQKYGKLDFAESSSKFCEERPDVLLFVAGAHNLSPVNESIQDGGSTHYRNIFSSVDTRFELERASFWIPN